MIRAYLLIAAVLITGLTLSASDQPQPSGHQRSASRTELARLKPSKPISIAAVTVKRAAPEVFSKEQCAQCHEDEVASFDNTTHSRVWHSNAEPCANCHGDATAHVKAGGAKGTILNIKKDLSPAQASQTCLNCHEKAGEQSHMRLSEHAKAGITCVDCHNVHPDDAATIAAGKRGKGSMVPPNQLESCLTCHTNVRAEISMPSHHRMKEGAMECSSCHNVHGTLQGRQVRAQGRDQCVLCHTDKRGPFMFGHEAINMEGCVACHNSHGGAAKNMLKERDQRQLCLSCHSRDIGAGVPHGRASATTMGDCTRCHTAVHGSNVDPFLLH